MCAGHYGQFWRGESLRPLRGSTDRRERSKFYINYSMEERECSLCHVVKPFAEFNRHKGKPASRCRTCARTLVNANSCLAHGITPEQFAGMLEEQEGRCAICPRTEPGGQGRWHIDHDHRCCPGKRSCGKCVRGLLCSTCNAGLGMLGDDPVVLRRATEYLIQFGQRMQ